MNDRFRDRRHAGRAIAALMGSYAGRSDVVVVALPRGGVPVGYEVAMSLHSPLDICIVRKLGAPRQPELALGAIASGGIRVLNDWLVAEMGISTWAVDEIAAREELEIRRREAMYRRGAQRAELANRVCIVVDDGLATGASMLAAVTSIKAMHPRKVVAAIPVASAESCEVMAAHVDRVLCVKTPTNLYDVGAWYDDFTQTTDEEVCHLLDAARANVAAQSAYT